jgi:HYDIN/CFA65/VesB family protein
MTGFVIPYETHQTDSRVWVAWWAKDQQPPLTLQVRNLNLEALREIPLDGGWLSIGLEGAEINEVVCQYQVVTLNGLAPATTYQLALVRSNGGRAEAVGFVETLPDRLPAPGGTELSKRPFTIMLGSCYYAPDDPDSKVDEAYVRLWNSPKHRPHLKILCGDQVYLDQPAGPATPMVDRMSSEELRRWIIAKYRQTWLNLDDMMKRGANYMTSDDHEFWNDYPERPLIWGWRALYQSLQYRRDWGREATAHFREIQQGANVTQLDIGADLSIFIADTRVNRQRDGVHFMSAQDFDRMIQWIRGLRMPGVLVLGQPLIARPTNMETFTADLITTDHNLPYFVQYDDLMSALSWWCYHDLLVLAGDVHFGRIARFSIPRSPDIYPAVIYEVVSSAMTVLPSAKNRFHVGPNGEAFPRVFPPYDNRQLNRQGSRITYEKVVPRMADDQSGTENHFMTLQFTRHPSGRGVEVNIRPWLVNRNPDGDLPASAWTYTCSLDVNRQTSAYAMIAPPVLDLGEVRRNVPVMRDDSLTVSSIGPVPLIIQSITLQGEHAAAFGVTPHPPRAFPVRLEPGEAFPVSVRFQSASVGEHEAYVVVTGADLAGAPAIVQAVLMADVIAPDMIVLPTAVNFGLIQVGQQIVRNVVVSSYGTAPLRFRVDPPVSQSPFQWTGDAPNVWRTLAPGEDAIIALRYLPTTIGAHSTSVVIASDDETVSVALFGEGTPPPRPEIRAAPRQLSFGVINVGTTATLQLTLANDGTAPLTISATRIEGPDGKLFALPGPVPTVIKAGQTALVAVRFSPAASVAGGYRATLVIESNANNDPRLSVSLFGSGAASSLRVVPTQIAFNPSPLAGTLPPGLGSRRGLDIYNVGAAPLTIAGSSFRILEAAGGQVSPHFEILDAAGQAFPQNNVQLNAGAFLSLSVQFRPVTAGAHAARIVITPTDQAEPQVTVSISGQGVG